MDRLVWCGSSVMIDADVGFGMERHVVRDRASGDLAIGDTTLRA